MLGKKIKADARKMLREKWFGLPAKACLVWLLLNLALSTLLGIYVISIMNSYGTYVDGVGSSKVSLNKFMEFDLNPWLGGIIMVLAILVIYVLWVLRVGLTRLMFRYTDNPKQRVGELFYYFSSFKRFWKATLLSLNVQFRITLGAIPFGILVMACVLCENKLGEYFVMPMILRCVLGLLPFAGFVLYSIWQYKYFAAEVAWVKGDGEVGINESIKRSVLATRGRRTRLLLFDLSFILISLLFVFIITIPFILEYYLLSRVIYARYLLECLETEQNPKDQENCQSIKEIKPQAQDGEKSFQEVETEGINE